MAKISFSPKDFARMQPPQKGMHKFEVTEVSDKLSKSKDSTNFYFALKVIESGVDDLNIGRVIETQFIKLLWWIILFIRQRCKVILFNYKCRTTFIWHRYWQFFFI